MCEAASLRPPGKLNASAAVMRLILCRRRRVGCARSARELARAAASTASYHPDMHIGALVLVIAIVGNVIFWMTLLGLVYRLAMSHRTWLILVTVGVAVAVVTSGLMLRQVGLRGPKLLRQDHWHRTPPAWRAAVIASAGVAAIWAAFIGTRRFRYRAPSLV